MIIDLKEGVELIYAASLRDLKNVFPIVNDIKNHILRKFYAKSLEVSKIVHNFA